jgi:HlyD family secretion protein
MQTKKRRRKAYIYYALAAIIIVGFFVVRARLTGVAAPIIRTAVVERGTVTATVSANGVLQPLTTVQVKSNVGGSIVKLAVDEGDRVKAGQLIARIDPSDTQTTLDQSQADLAAAVSKVDQAKQTLSMQDDQNAAQIASAQHGLEGAKTKLLQAQEQAQIQPALTSASVKQARSAYAAATAAMNQTKTALTPQKLSSAQAGYDQAKASYANADADYNRQKALLEKGYVAKSAVDTAAEKYGVAKASLDSASSKLSTIKAETGEDLRSAEARMEQSKADLDSAIANQVQDKVKQQEATAARAAMKQAEAALRVAVAATHQTRIKRGDIIQANAQVTRSQATLKNARTQLGYTTVVAPSDGIVTKKYVEVGSIVTAGRSSALGSGSGVAIVDIADETKMSALVNVDETDIAQIEIGQEVDITIEAYPDELFSGKVTKIAPQSIVDQNVTTIPVTVEVELPDARLKPGMNATCDFITNRKQNVLMVPNEAVKEADTSTTVTVLEKGEQVSRKVEAGLVGKDYTEIIKGLKEGQKIVTAVIQPVSSQPSAGGARPPGGMGGPGGPGGMGGMRGR